MCRPDEVGLPASARHPHAVSELGIHLPPKINLERGVDGPEPIMARKCARIMGPRDRTELQRAVPGRWRFCCGAEDPGGHRFALIYRFGASSDSAACDEPAQRRCQNARVKPEIALLAETLHDR